MLATLPRLVPTLALLLLPACGLLDGASAGASEGDSEAATFGTAATFVPTTGEPTHCVGVDDCPAAALCERVQCIDDACVYTRRAAGQPDDDIPGDCHSYVCDGNSGATPVDDLNDLPDDGNSCTVDACSPDAAPENTPQDPGSPCDGGYCHADLSCQPCAERETCEDTSLAEPNETQSKAFALPQQSDADDITYLCEALGSPGDVDWFTFDAIDSVLGKVAPAVVGDPDDLQVCVYFQCKNAGTKVVCPGDSVADNAPLGQQGCCGFGSFQPYLDCKGLDEDASVWIEVRRDPDLPADPPASCVNYQLGYEY
ncbi:MAG: hypothetical protein IPO88_09400 [Nannocystis sp.]|uniref:hypothetical protein n=1 Tax=Nannocystis sp. TaxID=1962667 RepID=UPI00242192BA|nr:hypothetical protein [Nannocystis sp.]MBK9753705.1 hypothetical protein [Nannocystis sp.]